MSKLGTQEDRGEDIPGTGTARAKADTGNPYGSQKPFREQGGVRAVSRHEGTRPHLAALQTPSQSQARWSHCPPVLSTTLPMHLTRMGKAVLFLVALVAGWKDTHNVWLSLADTKCQQDSTTPGRLVDLHVAPWDTRSVNTVRR